VPVIVEPADYARWLGEEESPASNITTFLRPFPAERMEAHPIGPAVGNVKNEGPSLIEPMSPAAG
jgi:putative SOS response-associated peptidase YedK